MSGPDDEGRDPSAPRINPMGIGAVFEIGVRILRRHFGVLLPLSLLFVGPAALLTAATGVRFTEVAADILPVTEDGLLDTSPIALTELEVERLVGALVVFVLASAVAGALTTIAALGFSDIVGADYVARATSLRVALRACLVGALPVLGMILLTSLLTIAILGGGTLLIVIVLQLLAGGDVGAGGPGVFVALILGVAMVVAVIYLTMRWAMAVPAIALDRAGVLDALRTSWHLTTDNLTRTIVIVLLGSFVTAILSALLAQLLALIVVDVLASQLGLDPAIAETLVVATSSVLLAPLLPILIAVLFHDLKVRRDSWEPY